MTLSLWKSISALVVTVGLSMPGVAQVTLKRGAVVYCGSGHRSTIAMPILWSYGYTDVLSMRGGVAEWVKAGYPVGDFEPEP